MHHPRTLVLGGNPGRWHWTDRAHEAPFATGIESWVHAMRGTYIDHRSATLEDVNEYELVICNTNNPRSESAVARYTKLAEQRRASVNWVSLLEGDMRQYMIPSVHHAITCALHRQSLPLRGHCCLLNPGVRTCASRVHLWTLTTSLHLCNKNGCKCAVDQHG